MVGDEGFRRAARKARRVGLGFLLAGLITGAVAIVRVAIAESSLYSNASPNMAGGLAAEQGLMDLAAGVMALSLVLVAIGGWILSRLARSAR